MADFDIPEGAEERRRRLDAAEADHVAAVEKRRAASKAVESLVKAYAEAEAVLQAARAEEDAAFDRYRAIAEVTPWYMSSSARGLLGSVGPSAEGSTCSRCGGTGRIEEPNDCRACGGVKATTQEGV